MELVSVILARSALLLEVDSLDPFGRRSASEAIKEIQDRYSFVLAPQGLVDINSEKGAEFSSGRWQDIVIDRLTLFRGGIVVDTRSSTQNSDRVAEDLVEASKELLGSTAQISRRHVVSQFTFRSQMVLQSMNPVLTEISEKIMEVVSASMGQPFVAEPTGIIVHTDTTQTKFAPAKFTIERRADIPFFENIYFSSAPLATATHINLVERFEASILPR